MLALVSDASAGGGGGGWRGAEGRDEALGEARDSAERGALRLSPAALEAGRGSLGGRDPSEADGRAGAVTLQGELLKRRARDTYGCWRCFGESWARRWFTLRDCVLYYSRRSTDRRARGAMPLGQCRLELKGSGEGRYIKLSSRFSHRTMRIKGATEEATDRWLRELRVAAGLPPIAIVDADKPREGVRLAPAGLTRPAAPRSDGETGSEADGRRSGGVLPPVDILEGAEAASLSMSQRCSWLYASPPRHHHLRRAQRATVWNRL